MVAPGCKVRAYGTDDVWTGIQSKLCLTSAVTPIGSERLGPAHIRVVRIRKEQLMDLLHSPGMTNTVRRPSNYGPEC